MIAHIAHAELVAYLRAKIDQLLGVMGTLPLRPEELDDATLVVLDPIGIIAESFRQVLEHLNETNAQLEVAQGEIRAIFDTLGAAVVVTDMHDRIAECNRLADKWFFGGSGPVNVIGKAAAEVCEYAGVLAGIRHAADGQPHMATVYGRDLQVVASKIADAAGNQVRTVMLFSDITAQKAAERHLHLYAQAFRSLGEGILITDRDNRVIEANEAVSRITGHEREALLGSTPRIFASGMHETAFYEQLWGTLRRDGVWRGEILDRTADGRVVPLLETISEVRDAAGELTHHIAVMSDISALKDTQDRLDFLAHHDPLTDLPNRLLFADRLEHAIARARRDEDRLALLYIDLDRFKNVNDGLGHHVGDLLLVESSRRLRELVRESDTVARLGGDEFVVLMESDVSQFAAVHLADKIVAAFKLPFAIGDDVLHIGCSIGITLFPEDGTDSGTLLRNADAAMYRAKESGREGHSRYTAALSEATRGRLEIDNALRAAVRDGGFELHYQPIVDVAAGRVIAAEALLRWPRAPAGAATPDLFIPVAEENRLIVPLGQWVLREALARLRGWQAEGIALDYISVNISAVQMAHPEFPDSVIAALRETGVPGRQLQIELTENVLMGDIERCSRVLERLREYGIRVAIDDFGTGYSSLSYLRQLPIDNLKIDRSFVRDIPGDINDCAIADAVLSLARTLGLEAIAEGIETADQGAYLARIGCSKVQGFLHSRPLPAAGFAAFIKR